MEYRYLGKTGIKVSVLAYGNWLNSLSEKDQQVTTDTIRRCWEHGVNFFDTAESYGDGAAETAMGVALKEIGMPRKDFVLSTKFIKCGTGQNDKGLSRKHIVEACNNSLKRLQVDYIDVVFCHRPDYDCPLEETLRAMSWLIDQGKAHYWGTSEWPADMISRAIEMCERLNLHKPVVEQAQYSLLWRNTMEKSYRHIFNEYGYGTTIWSPLAGGLLSGKYNDGSIPEDSRYAKHDFIKNMVWGRWMGPGKQEETCAKLTKLGEIAKEVGYTQVQLALAWAIANKDVSVCLLGFSRLEQVDENMKALELYQKWNPELEKKIRDAIGGEPEPDMDWRTWTPLKQRRDIQLAKF